MQVGLCNADVLEGVLSNRLNALWYEECCSSLSNLFAVRRYGRTWQQLVSAAIDFALWAA